MAHWSRRSRKQEQCLIAGDYDAVLRKVEKAVSKKGNDMAVLDFNVNHDGRGWALRDWIVAGFAKKKLADLAAALGRDAATFRLSQQIGVACRVRVGVENDPSYGWTNRIEKYLSAGCGSPANLSTPVVSEWPVFDFNDPNPPY